MFIIEKNIALQVRNILHIIVKKTYQILSNDYNFYRPWKWNTIFQKSFTMS